LRKAKPLRTAAPQRAGRFTPRQNGFIIFAAVTKISRLVGRCCRAALNMGEAAASPYPNGHQKTKPPATLQSAAIKLNKGQ
jgi:hypothetical protein